MQIVLFSKHWKDPEVDTIIEKTLDIGADGLDFTVRPGYCVTPDNVGTELPKTVRRIKEAGLAVPMIPTDGKFTSASDPSAEPTAAAMQEAGVPIGKLGYFPWRASQTPYWETVDKARRELEGLETLGRKYGIKFCYHTHSHYFGQNAAALMDLLKGRDPKHIGAYLDTGHLYFCGEGFPMAIDVVGEYLSMASLKDTCFVRENAPEEELPVWKRTIVPAGLGVVNWQDVFTGLLGAGYDDTCSAHCEFRADTPDAFHDLQKREVAFLRDELAKARAALETP